MPLGDHTPSAATARLGLAGAMATLAFSLAYIVAQLAEWAGWLGSAGGPESASTAAGIRWLLLPSLLLGSAFLVAMAAFHQAMAERRRAFSLAALAFAVVYATLTGLVYFVQLTFVAPRLEAGDTGQIGLLLFTPYQSFLFAVDLLGYAMMCLSTLLAGLALEGDQERGLRRALIANGLLFPFLALQMQVPALIFIAALWAVTFPLAMALLARMFWRLSLPG